MRPHSCPPWRLAVPLAMSAAVVFSIAPPALAEPDAGAVLTLQEALSQALARSPALAGVDDAVRAQDGRVRQAGLWTNPQIGVEVENVGGSGDRSGTEQTETTFRLAQLVELGGKRDHRRRVAELGRVVSEREREAGRLAVAAEVRQRFVDALAAQERRRVALEVERAFAEAAAGVDKRIAAGTASPAEQSSIRASHELSRVNVLRAERDLGSAFLALAATWSSTAPEFSSVAGDLDELPPLPPLATLLDTLDGNPDLKKLDAEVDRLTAAAGLERARWVPDVTLTAGGRHFNDNDDFAAVFEVSMPLPIFDRSQGGIVETQHLIAQAAAERDAGRVQRRAALQLAHEALRADLATVDLLQEQAVPRSHAAVEQAATAYRRGAARLIEVLDAQRLSQTVHNELIDALVSCHRGFIAIERLASTSMVDAGETGVSK